MRTGLTWLCVYRCCRQLDRRREGGTDGEREGRTEGGRGWGSEEGENDRSKPMNSEREGERRVCRLFSL